MFQKVPIRADHVDSGPGRTLPHLFEPGSGMRRFIVAPDLAYRAGFTKVAPGQGFKTFFWYDEFWVVIQGGARVTAVDRPTNTTMTESLETHDCVFIPAGTHIAVDHPKSASQPLLFYYIAIPASSKHASWIASMKPEDLEDIRRRQEHTKEGAATEAQRGKPVRT
jgi:mannose-6-phosphate isomerase-like protein (cupin superfamily)